MAKWTFEPGHTAPEFCARHMMVTYVRGRFIVGDLIEITIDAEAILETA